MLRPFFLLLVFALELSAQRGGFGQRDTIPAGSRVEYKTFQSKLLARELRYGLYLPASYNNSAKRYPVLYFLHGMYENEMRWSSRGQTDLMLDRMMADGKIGEFIVAIPFGGTSFYTNTRDGSERWEDAFITEFIPMIESTYRVNASRTTRGISGISMGGYGALKIAMKHPDLFGSASAHSAVLLKDLSAARVSAGRLQMFQGLFDRIYAISQDLSYWEANNPMTLAIDTKKFNGLKSYYPHEAHLYPGRHGWDYAAQHTSESLLFHWKAFSGK